MKKEPTLKIQNQVVPNTVKARNQLPPIKKDQLTHINSIKIKNQVTPSSGVEAKKHQSTNQRNLPANAKNKRNKQMKIPLTIIPETTLPQIDQNISDKNKENEEKEGVPLEAFGNNIRILVQKNEANWAECFMCCASKDTIFIPNLNENPITQVTCSKCLFDILRFGVMYNPFPIFNPGSKELYICLNCKTIYSPLQYELAIASIANNNL